MEKKEFLKILAYVFTEHDEPSDAVITVWYDQFGKLDSNLLMQAARELKQQVTYGAPKTQDMWAAVTRVQLPNLPESLQWSGAEALANMAARPNKLLTQDARNFANRAVPPIPGDRQFANPEDVAKAQQIRQLSWEKQFKERYDTMRDRVLAQVRGGLEAKQAIVLVVGQGGFVEHPALGMSERSGTHQQQQLIEMAGK